jgi:hypothetical protein
MSSIWTRRELHTILYLGYFPTNFAQYLSSPSLAFTQALARTCHAWAPVTPGPKSKLCRLRFAEAVKHGLRLFFITSLGESVRTSQVFC